MDDIRELQRQKWLKAQEEKAKSEASSSASPPEAAGASSSASGSPYTAAPAPAATSTANAAGSSSSQQTPLASAPAPEGELAAVRRLHLLPIGPSADISGEPRLQLLAPELRRRRQDKVPLRSGQFLSSSGHDFVVVKAEPEHGLLVSDTDYFVDGEYVLKFDKVQFIALKDFQSPLEAGDPSALFAEYISPYFKGITESSEGGGSVVTIQEVVTIGDKEFKVMAAEPSDREMGIIDKSTMVFVDWDSTPEFDKIHIVPFQDTLPGAYQFDVFQDYLKPYLSRNKHMSFSANDQFIYQGVQFKVVCCEPPGPGRIGRNTTIYCEGMLHPSLRNLLPPELLAQLQELPPGLQMLLMNTEAVAGGYEERLIEVQEMLSRRRGLSNDTISQVVQFKWGDEGQGNCDQTQCMVCLSDFEHGEEVRKLPCGHVFHSSCIDEWLRRCTDCPICKANVDRAVRQY